jgi:hypothetical protein
MARNVLLKRSAAHVTARGPARSPVWAPRLDFYLRPIPATYPVWNYKPMWIAKAFFGVLLMLSLASCGESKEAQPTIAIQRSAPSGDHPLVVGETTRFSIEIRAQNFQGPGHVGLVIQTAEGAVLVASDPTSIDAGQIVQLGSFSNSPKDCFGPRLHASIPRRQDANLGARHQNLQSAVSNGKIRPTSDTRHAPLYPAGTTRR